MKRKMWNRIISVFIAVALMVSALPINAFAEGNESFEGASLANVQEVQSEGSGGSEENYFESSNVEVQEVEENKEEIAETTETTEAAEETTETTEETGSDSSAEGVSEDNTVQSEEESQATEASKEANDVMGEESVGLLLYSVDNLNSLDELVELANKTDVASVSLDKNTKTITVNVGGLILLSNADVDFSTYTIFLSTLIGGYADLTQMITIEETSTDENGVPTTTSQDYSFQGLGSETYPFSGTLKSQDGSYGVILNVPFFRNVDVSKIKFTTFSTLKMKQKGNTTSAMLAANVSGISENNWKSLKIEVGKESVFDGGTTTDYLPTALIATMAENASLSLGEVSYTDGAEVKNSPNAGLLCNTMEGNSTLSVQNLTLAGTVSVTAASGSAGGLVGVMENGASLTVNDGAEAASVTIGSNYPITGQNAGGLIGIGTDVKLDVKVTIDGAKVNGSVAVGGLIGSYTTGVSENSFTTYVGSDTSTLKVNSVKLETTADSAYAGGLFGALELKSDFSISDASVTSTIAGSKAYYGGLVGQVKGDSVDYLRALTISDTSNPKTTTTVNINGYAGAVAVVGDTSSPVYVKIEGKFTPTFVGANLLRKDTYFGGVAAYLKSDSVLELTADVTIVYDKIAETNGYGGGVLGKAERGSTLCLDGTTDLSGTKFKETYINEYTGQIVGTQESALIYAKSDWKLIRQSTAQELDDIGTYGEVIRLGGNMGMGLSGLSGLSADLISQNATTHKTEFLASAKLTLTNNTFTVTSADELALLAIEEQTKCAFQIYGTGDDYYLKSTPNITLGADISLAHTGITSLQRDNGACTEYGGILDGQNHTLTIAAGEIYGYRGDTNAQATDTTSGSGQIHGHTQVGFFSHANAKVNNLTVDGGMNLYFRTKTTDTSTTYLAGGLAAKNTVASTYTNVTISVSIQYQGATSGSIGGLVGLGTVLTFSGCTGNATINAGNSAVYAGGLIGQYTGATLSVSDTTLNGTMTATGANHARLGGLVSRIAKGNYDEVTVTLTDITVDGQTIMGTGIKGSTVNNVLIPASCGGLLGYEWNNASVTFGNKDSHDHGLTVTGDSTNSSVTVDGTTETAGLVYAATGYWQVNDIKLEKLSIASVRGNLGLLICRGWRKDIPTDSSKTTKPYLLYLEEAANNAYQIGNVSVSNTDGYFDEWVVYTCESKETIMNNGNSVISIATKAGTLVENQRAGVDPIGDNCTSYQNRTEYGKTATANPNARYYYDLDVIRAAAQSASPNSLVNTPGELVLWAVWRYAEKTGGEKSNIADYFYVADIGGASMTGNGNLIDLTGYAYYPITVDGFGLTITNINIKFANQEIENAESKTEDLLDSLNRTAVGTTESHTQHYLLHSGLLLNYQNSAAGSDVTMTVSKVTFQGIIGKGSNGGSGALICGQLGGNIDATSPKYAKLDIQSVKLDDVSVNANKTSADSDYAPLLVNRVGSYSSLSAQNVSTYGYDGVTSTNNPAATSLIGHVGSDTATNITLAFSNGINLKGKKENSIFSHATLLESFRYQSGGSGYYRFYEGDTFTYGREISESVENKDLQLWYSRGNPKDQLVNVTDGSTTEFKDYLPYVCKSYTDGTDKYHELEVNLASPDLTEGCGTYDDPYIISSPGQLMRAADFINGNSPQTGWKVNKVTDAAAVKTEENDNHTEYEVGITGWDDAAMRTYMRRAYYQIKKELSGDLTLKSFAGFGSVNNPFVGVFDGNGKTIIIENAGSGFINVSYGSVVRNLTINYTGTKIMDSLPQNVDPNNSHTAYASSYFGGIIGTVLGGDSLIDNVKVNMDGFTITTSYDLQCAGGFVGLIQGGGVVFRNMGNTTQNQGYTNDEGKDRYYVDNYIGRVLDGYAINEVTGFVTDASVTFGGKNYSIPNISSERNETSITSNGGTISIGNAQQMIVFADIINSGAANGGTGPAYVSNKAKTRNADYTKIGNISDVADTAFVTSRKDDTLLGGENYPYLITKYAGNAGGFWTACTTGEISVTFQENAFIDLSPYGNGYRGIGGRYHCNANGGMLTNNTPKIKTVTGNNVSLHVENDIEECRTDNFYSNAVGGIFNVLRHEGANITGVNVYGTVKVCAGLGEKNTDIQATYLARAPVGGVIGRDYCPSDNNQTLTLTKVSFGSNTEDFKSVIYGECVTGGLLGSSGSYAKTVLDNGKNKNKTTLVLMNCSYQNVNITGGVASGGLVASGVPNSATFVNSSEKGASNAESGIKIRVTESLISGSNADIRILYNVSGEGTANGLGGLIGFCGTTLKIEGTESSPVSVQNITVQGAGDTLRARVGGLVGFMANENSTNGSKADCTIQYANLSNIKIGMSGSYDDNAGSIMGTWYSYGTLKCLVCTVDTADIQANSSGGIVGYAARGPIHSIRITLSSITVRKRGSSKYAGGLGGQVSCAFYGQHILMKCFSYVDDYNATNKKNINDLGRFFGNGTYARLIGMTIQDPATNLPTYEIRGVDNTSIGTSNYVVYAGYDSSGTITTASDIATKPSQAIHGITVDLHGDTVEPNTVLGAAGNAVFYQNAGRKDKLIDSIRSTYNVQQDNDIDDDFPVVLIDGDASVLRQYLNAATNGGFDSMRKYQTSNTSGGKVNVTIDRYLYDKNLKTFSKADAKAYPATLKYHESTGEFTTTAQYDNQKDTFTLVTVTMTGYSTSDKFVLHIPVIVRRMLQVDFMATMTSGTVFNKTDGFYSETKNHALASKGENITGYLTFHYNSNASDTANPASYDWQSYMEGGGDLLGYFKKTVDTGTNPLPASTKITLIDCQNGDRRYYASVEVDKTSQLELFNGENLTFTASNGDPFTPATLSDLLQITAETADDTATVKWVKLENETNATVKATDGNYYCLYDANTNTDITELYTLTVGEDSPTENYFVVISVPEAKNHRLTLDKADMAWSNPDTTSPPLEVHQVHRYDPTKPDPKDGNSEASFNYLDNYQQNLEDKTIAGNVQVQTTSAKAELPIDVKNTVTFTPANYNESDPLYQELVVSLKKTEKGATTTVGIPSDAVAVTNTDSGTTTENAVKLYAYYLDKSGQKQYYAWNGNGLEKSGTAKVPAASYAWSASADSSEMVLPFAVKTDGAYQYIDLAVLRKASEGKFFLEAETTLEMSMASVMTNNTIPYDAANGGTIENYTQIDAASILSFTESGLSYSTLKGNVAGNKKYYLNTERKAILKLDYINIDQLGINLLADQTATIDTILTLDFSNMEGFVSDVTQFKTLSEADKVQFTLSLQKKGDSSYEDASIGKYLSSAKTSDSNSLSDYKITIFKNGDGSYDYYNEQTGQFNIPICFAVNTDVREFANYRIRASVTLFKEENPQYLDVNVTNAFITYTYVKINVNGYWD